MLMTTLLSGSWLIKIVYCAAIKKNASAKLINYICVCVCVFTYLNNGINKPYTVNEHKAMRQQLTMTYEYK